jgi:TolB-like protein/Flp pilus assembly protein TadD/predicted Ser/Thr protein kinase
LLTEGAECLPSLPVRPLPALEDYELLEEIGRGGQGVVYRARQKSLNRLVALKVIGVATWATESQLRRFWREAETAASLDHPAIVPVHEIRERDGYCYFSMKLIEGAPLDEVIKREELSIHRSAKMLAQLAHAVHFAHERGILHRDIKPGNVLVDRHGNPHLTDFGLACLTGADANVTRTGEMLGTPSYMAPEQVRDPAAELTRETDNYALGAVLYHMLTGRPPFAAASPYEAVRLLLETEPRSPDAFNPKVDKDLATICLKCLEKVPSARYPSALELATDVEHWLHREPIQARRTSVFRRGGKWLQRNPATAVSGTLMCAFVMALGCMLWPKLFLHSSPASRIAVLPFENMGDKENAFFADGVQDDLIIKLSKVTALGVVSRTSVMSYRGKRDVRQIGEALNVAHLLEGSVQRRAGRLHVNAELVDTRNDANVWAEEYDGDLADLFTIQSEIARKVAERLSLRLTPAEKLAIERPPTTDVAAFDLFTQGKNLFLAAALRETTGKDLLRAADLLDQAVARDPSFLQAYCQLASIHDQLYFLGHDHSPRRVALAEAAVAAAARIRPEAGEVHLARAENLYRGHLDYAGALAELKTAQRNLPNDPRVFELAGYILRRQGRHEEGVRALEKAAALDPRNISLLLQLSNSYGALRRWDRATAISDRTLSINPADPVLQVGRAAWDVTWKADTRRLHDTLESLRVTNPSLASELANSALVCALMERDLPAARRALAARSESTVLDDNTIHFPRAFAEGLIARLAGDGDAATSAFLRALPVAEKVVAAAPGYGPPHMTVGVIAAFLGRKDDALREGRLGVELLPISKDAYNGPILQEYLAVIAAWAGETDLACEELEKSARCANGAAYGDLKLMPYWDPLRGNPRFEAIVASLAPK